MRPKEATRYPPVELKLGIKSSLPRAKSAIGLILALWKSCGQKGEISYSKEESGSIVVNDQAFELLKNYFGPLIADGANFRAKLNGNQLFKSQIESLIVAFELIWKMAVFKFEDSDSPFSVEREGQVRYTKRIHFTKNVDVINLVIAPKEDAYKQVLYSWIMGKSLGSQYAESETALVRGLTLISEEAVYRLRLDDSKDFKFLNQGIYSVLVGGSEEVDATDYKENMGGLRILHSLISENLNLYLKKQNTSISLRDPSKIEELKEYTKRVEKYLELTTNKIEVIIRDYEGPEEAVGGSADIRYPHNRIIFGGPGTGKSYVLNQQRIPFGENYERVTFHPTYSYAQFVGSYKPKPKKKDDGTEYVSYEFVAGPFLRMWVKATKDPGENFLLIIEEINRSNAAGVFGDVFQLLDRLEDGSSEYPISTSEEMKEYLINEHEFSTTEASEIKIPGNLYIWVTMNSADQGVFPIDTAFKRRWDFTYLDIDHSSSDIQGKAINLKPFGEIEWDKLRRKINDRLTEADLNVNEDKLIAPFFLNDKDLRSGNIDEVFKSKLLMYLFEDVLKHRKGKFFKSQYNTFSKIVRAYDDGENIFDFDVVDGEAVEETPEAE